MARLCQCVCRSSCHAAPRRATLAPFSRTSPVLWPASHDATVSAISERSRLSHWYSEPISSSLSRLLLSLLSFRPVRSACNGALYFTSDSIRDADKLVRRRENISPVSFLSFSLLFPPVRSSIMTVDFSVKWQNLKRNWDAAVFGSESANFRFLRYFPSRYKLKITKKFERSDNGYFGTRLYF